MATFGYSTIGGSNIAVASSFIQGCKHTLTEAGTVSKLSVYLQGGGTASQVHRGLLYADSAGSPAGLLASSAEVNVAAGATAGFVDFTLTNPPSLSAGNYWLCLWSGTASSGSKVYYDTVTNALDFVAAAYSTAGAPPDPFGTPTAASRQMSIFATYTPSGSAPVAQKAHTAAAPYLLLLRSN